MMFLKLVSSKLCSSKVILKLKPVPTAEQKNQLSERRQFCDAASVRPSVALCPLVESASASSKNSSFDAGVAPSAISLLAIKKTIKNNGEVSDGFCCLRTVCPVCSPAQSTHSNIYVNKITGTVVCPSCQLVRSWNAMEKFFLPVTAKNAKDMAAQRNAFVQSKQPVRKKLGLPKTAQSITKLSKAEIVSIMNRLGFENCNVTALQNLKSMYDETTESLFFPMVDVDGTIVGYKRLAKEDDRTVEQSIPDANCFGVIALDPSAGTKAAKETTNSAILVLNVLDLLALSTQKLSSTVVCLPHGFQSLPQECLPSLERYQRLVLWFHYDAVGWDTARSFSSKLDEKRCVFVRPTDTQPSPYVALIEGLDIKAILATAQPILHKAITTFRSLRQDVLSELQNIEKVQGVKWQRYPVLNKLLKGHRRGELTVLTGPTGCGKTTFMSEYSLDLALQGVTTLWGSFEIRNTRLASTLLRQLAGHPFDERLGEFDRWADEFERLPMFFMTFYGQQTIKVVMETIEHAQYVHDIQHVIIDNVQFMMGTADEPRHIDRFWRQDAIIAAFRTFATKRNCHVTLVIHPRKERDAEDLTTNSIFGSAKATQEADTVLIIQDKRLTAIRGKKYLQVAKNRYSGDLGIMPLDFDKEGLSYAAKRKKIEERSEETALA